MTDESWIRPGAEAWWVPWTVAVVVRVEIVGAGRWIRDGLEVREPPGRNAPFPVPPHRLFRTRAEAERATALAVLARLPS